MFTYITMSINQSINHLSSVYHLSFYHLSTYPDYLWVHTTTSNSNSTSKEFYPLYVLCCLFFPVFSFSIFVKPFFDNEKFNFHQPQYIYLLLNNLIYPNLASHLLDFWLHHWFLMLMWSFFMAPPFLWSLAMLPPPRGEKKRSIRTKERNDWRSRRAYTGFIYL